MNQEFKQEWMAALTSGEFTQTQGALRTTEGYCCLGVACELMARRGWGTWSGSDFIYTGPGCAEDMMYDLAIGVLPSSMAEHLGMSRNPSCGPMKEHGLNSDMCAEASLAALNDAGRDFAYIAKTIDTFL